MARHVKMTDMPQLVAAFHSLVGLAAVFVAAPRSMRRRPSASARSGTSTAQALIEMSLGVAIGAFTFTGSVIAFAKLNGNMSGKPILLPARHLIHIALGVAARRADRRCSSRTGEPMRCSGRSRCWRWCSAG